MVLSGRLGTIRMARLFEANAAEREVLHELGGKKLRGSLRGLHCVLCCIACFFVFEIPLLC